jgi:hypothetical protein
MPINACTIDSYTIDSLACRGRRQVIIDNLLKKKTAGPGMPRPGWVRPVRPADLFKPIVPTELNRILVQVNVFGLYGEEGQDVYPDYNLVTVTDIEIEPTAVSVNINGFRIN